MSSDLTYSFDFNVAESTIQSMLSASQRIERRLRELTGALWPTPADWDSQAREAYNYAQQVWNSAAQDMATNLAQAKTALETISGNH